MKLHAQVQSILCNNAHKEIVFNAVVQNQAAKEYLVEHLKEEICEELLNFIEEVNLLVGLTVQNENVVRAFKSIFDTYLSADAPKELNVSDKVLRPLKNAVVNESTNTSKHIEMLKDISETIRNLLLSDVFPRFVSSARFSRVVKHIPSALEHFQ